MTTGLILIAAILVLGGAIASVGDRIGTKVGKARLSLFGLRPKNTAVLITVITGSMISGSTLAILFGASEQLRTGVFKLESIQKNLKNARQEIEQTKTEKNQAETEKKQVQDELTKAQSEQVVAQQRLDATNQSLQLALAKLSEAMSKQSRTEAQLNKTQGQLGETQGKLSQTQSQLSGTQSQLSDTESNLGKTQAQLKDVSEQANQLRQEIQRLQIERQNLMAESDRVKGLITELKQQLDRRDEKIAARERTIEQKDQEISERNLAIDQKDRKIADQDRTISEREKEIILRDRNIALRDRSIEQQEGRLKELEKSLKDRETQIALRDKQLAERGQKLSSLEQEVATLEQYYQDYQELRQGNVRILRGQVLATGVLRIVEPKAARQAVDRLLLEANRVATQRLRPGDKTYKEQVILIRQSEVNRLIDRIEDGSDYVVRIISAGNYVAGGESAVQVFADVSPNRIVFQAGEVVAATSADPGKMTEDQIRERIELLIAASQFRARSAGIVADRIQIGDDRIETLTRFLEQLKQSTQPIDVQLVAAEATYTAGPVKMDLIAIQNGQVIFRTGSEEKITG